MASSFVNTPLVLEVSRRERPQFKKHLVKLVEDDPNDAFSSVPYNVLHVDDVRAYIHCNIEETRKEAILSLYKKHLWDRDGSLKLKYTLL